MKKVMLLFILTYYSTLMFGQIKTDEQISEIEFYNATEKWFSAWKLVSKDIYKISKVDSVEFVFFDDKYVYSTSKTTITNNNHIKGHNLINLKLNWKKKLHNGEIILPDETLVPIGLMSFTAEIPKKKSKSFFVMPLPSFWKKSGVNSEKLDIDDLITGIFIHEFSHSQQMRNFGKQMTFLEKESNFEETFNDDLIQIIFQKDSNYSNLYKDEVNLLYGSIKNDLVDMTMLKKALSLMKYRRNKYFQKKYENLSNVDDFFLTMEGLGQYSMFLWLTHPKGGNIKKKDAIEGVRHNKSWWSQDEGFALFLVLERLSDSKEWIQSMFGDKTESVIKLIENEL